MFQPPKQKPGTTKKPGSGSDRLAKLKARFAAIRAKKAGGIAKKPTGQKAQQKRSTKQPVKRRPESSGEEQHVDPPPHMYIPADDEGGEDFDLSDIEGLNDDDLGDLSGLEDLLDDDEPQDDPRNPPRPNPKKPGKPKPRRVEEQPLEAADESAEETNAGQEGGYNPANPTISYIS